MSGINNTEIRKNGTYQAEACDLTSDGSGICKIREIGDTNDTGGFTVFVDGMIPGDTAEIKIIKTNKNYGYGKLIKLISPSENRIKPNCPVFKNCGGCALQHMNYNAQLNYKRKTVESCLVKIGGIKNTSELISETIGMNTSHNPYNYRNKTQFPVNFDIKTGKVNMGFFSKRTHDIINIDSCNISYQINDEIISVFRKFFDGIKNSPKLAYDEITHTGLIRHIFTRVGFHTGEIMVCIVINGDNLPNDICDKLIVGLKRIKGMTGIILNINKEKTNVILGKTNKTLWGADYITDYIGDKKFKISVNSFYQVNPVQTEKLYNKALEFAEVNQDYNCESTICIDAYCGIGTISIMFAPFVKKIYGVEIIPQAVNDAVENARINNITNAEFIAGKSERIIPQLLKMNKCIDLIIVDPPRKGCDISLLDAISDAKIKKVIYISCDPATLARDLKILCGHGGYEVQKVQPIDMFPHTMHVEVICCLKLKK
ncbi:MAG: 23S rRNA (uracil(1939)-C(5))-methyltransferase RlmD [Oscillospiraceae bacterium]|nr:23S rRNA (uracil(1939)-C(5))-methyltransferase RlmD [Oscillospiraceae bacterium]